MRSLFVGIIVLFFSALTVNGQQGISAGVDSVRTIPTPTEVRALIDATGELRTLEVDFQSRLQSMKASMPEYPESFWREFEARYNDSVRLSMLVPLYQKHFTADEIRGLTEFWKSPLGKRYIEEVPAMLQEGFVIGKQFRSQVFEELAKKMNLPLPK